MTDPSSPFYYRLYTRGISVVSPHRSIFIPEMHYYPTYSPEEIQTQSDNRKAHDKLMKRNYTLRILIRLLSFILLSMGFCLMVYIDATYSSKYFMGLLTFLSLVIGLFIYIFIWFFAYELFTDY